MKATLLTLILLLAAGCGRKTTVERPLIERGTWAAVRMTSSPSCKAPRCEGFTIWVRGNQGQTDAVKELCQKRAYICVGPEPAGKLITLERRQYRWRQYP